MVTQDELEENEDESRVCSLLSNLATGLEQGVDSEEPWRPDESPHWNSFDRARACRSLDPHVEVNSNWASESDGVRVKWAELAREGVLENGPRMEAPVPAEAPKTQEFELQAPPKIAPSTGEDGYRSTAELDEEWEVALSEAVLEAQVEEMDAALDTMVERSLGTPLVRSIEVLEDALSGIDGPVVLPLGAAEVDIIWELQRELDWNEEFKERLLSHLGLDARSVERDIFKALMGEVGEIRRRSSSLRRLKSRFKELVDKALDLRIELEVREQDPDDPFVRRLTAAGLSVPKSCRQDLLNESLEEIGA